MFTTTVDNTNQIKLTTLLLRRNRQLRKGKKYQAVSTTVYGIFNLTIY